MEASLKLSDHNWSDWLIAFHGRLKAKKVFHALTKLTTFMTTSELTEHHALTVKRRSQKLPIRVQVDEAAWIEANDLAMGIFVGCI